jgi:Leucine-rich repeat (LRR) protein
MNRNALSGPLPEELGLLSELRDLSADSNQITSAHLSIANNTKLAFLYMNTNRIAAPPPLASLAQLERIDLSANLLISCEQMFSARQSSLKYIYLDSNRLTELDEGICEAGSLQWAFLTANHLQKLPPCFSLLNLTILDISGNNLLADVSSIASMTSLTSLSLSNNSALAVLDALPAFERLVSLRSLKIIQMGLRVLPPLPSSLVSLDAGFNSIGPSVNLSCCPGLETLVLTSNALAAARVRAGRVLPASEDA